MSATSQLFVYVCELFRERNYFITTGSVVRGKSNEQDGRHFETVSTSKRGKKASMCIFGGCYRSLFVSEWFKASS